MTKLTEKLLDNSDSIYIPRYYKPVKIGGKRALLKYLKDELGITTIEQYENAVNDCLKIVKVGKVYYNDSSC